MVSPLRGPTEKMGEFIVSECVCVWGGGALLMQRIGKATLVAKPGSQRMKITAAHVPTVY